MGVVRRESVRVRGVAAGLFATATAVVGGAWYLRNALRVGNPFYPTPWFGLPHLERAGLVWRATSLLDRWRDLLGGDLAGDALFALPPARAPQMSLGPLALVALPVALVAAAAALPRARAAARESGALAALVALLVPAALVVLVGTYLRLPFWDNAGLFRSEVRFAVPAAAVAFALAFAWLSRRSGAERWLVAAGALGVLVQSWMAALWAGWSALARAGIWVALPLAAAAALIGLAPRAAGGRWRIAAGAAALATAALGLFAAWAFREAGRERRWLDPAAVYPPLRRGRARGRAGATRGGDRRLGDVEPQRVPRSVHRPAPRAPGDRGAGASRAGRLLRVPRR